MYLNQLIELNLNKLRKPYLAPKYGKERSGYEILIYILFVCDVSERTRGQLRVLKEYFLLHQHNAIN